MSFITLGLFQDEDTGDLIIADDVSILHPKILQHFYYIVELLVD
jgi:hypothetical protein